MNIKELLENAVIFKSNNATMIYNIDSSIYEIIDNYVENDCININCHFAFNALYINIYFDKHIKYFCIRDYKKYNIDSNDLLSYLNMVKRSYNIDKLLNI